MVLCYLSDYTCEVSEAEEIWLDSILTVLEDVKALEAEPAVEDFGLEPDSEVALDKARARLQRLESTGEATAWLQRLGLPQYAA